MKIYIKSVLLIFALILSSCADLVKDINDNPNKISIEETQPILFLTGALLANSVAHAGHLNRIGGLWTGQLVGYSSLYSNIYGYNISTAESDGTWRRIYIGVIPNLQYIINNTTNDPLLTGIAKTVNALAISTAAALFGDVPFTEINSEVEDPRFDDQIAVLNAAIEGVQSGITDLSNAPSRSMSEDIYFNGDADQWLAAAYTIKARLHLMMRDYANAYAAAQQGIGSPADNLSHIPRGDASTDDGDKNLFFEIIAGSRQGDIGSSGSYLLQMLSDTLPEYRGNAKTNEGARLGYYTINENSARDNLGIIGQFEPQAIVSFAENHLILAEAGARIQGFDVGLQHLNEFRAALNAGAGVNENFQDQAIQYDPYEAADFAAGGMENMDNLADDRALLREIMEEKYVSTFGSQVPFHDVRRLRKEDSDLIVPFPTNVSGGQYPERMPYASDELNSNSNAPSNDPGIYIKTAVNE